MAYADVKKLSDNDMVLVMKWIKTKRANPDTRSNIPVLPTAEAILEKYANHTDVSNGKDFCQF